MTVPEGTPRLQSQLSLRTREHFWVGFLPPRPRRADGDVNGLQTRTGHGLMHLKHRLNFFKKSRAYNEMPNIKPFACFVNHADAPRLGLGHAQVNLKLETGRGETVALSPGSPGARQRSQALRATGRGFD